MALETTHEGGNVPFIDAILPALGGMLAGGAFVAPAVAVDISGPAAFIGLLAALLLALALAHTSFAPAGGVRPFLSEWLSAGARLAAAAALAVILAAYLLPHASEPVQRAVSFGALLVACVVVATGVRTSPSVVSLATGAAVVGIGFYVGLAAPLVERANMVPFAPHGWGAIPSTVPILFFLFGGVEYVECLAPVLVRPGVNIRRARLLGVAMIASLALAVMLVSVGAGGSAFTTHRLFSRTEDHAPLLSMAAATGQPAALWGLSLAAVATCAVAIHRLISEAAGSLASMARLGHVPGGLGVVSRNAEGPWAAAMLAGAVVVSLAWWLPLTGLIAVATAALLASYGVRCGFQARQRADGSAGLWTLAAVSAGFACLAPPAGLNGVALLFVLAIAIMALRPLWITKR